MLKLSPSSLNLYLECPRCFWLRFVKGIYRPEGPSSTLPSGVDYTLKKHYDYHREKGLPPELVGKVPGRLLPDSEILSQMRSRNFGFLLNKDVWFGGMLDEVLLLPDGSIVPLDNKTRGFPPKESHWTYKIQMSGYSLILREKNFKTKNLAYLVHWFFDHKNMDHQNPLGFNVAVEEVKTDPDMVKEKIIEAVNSLKGKIPPAGVCDFCAYREQKGGG